MYTLIHFRATETKKILLSQFQKTADVDGKSIFEAAERIHTIIKCSHNNKK